MDAAKVQLSPAERTLVADPSWILTKNAVMAKVMEMMAGISEEITSPFVSDMPAWLKEMNLQPQSPKISRGENYKGLPYIVLDYPRIFEREEVFAIRTLFWWGHYFSLTLHLKGRFKALFLPVIIDHQHLLAAREYHIGIADEEWRHELAEDNYVSLRDIMHTDEMPALAAAGPFLKLTTICGFDNWEQAPEILIGQFRQLVRMLLSRV